MKAKEQRTEKRREKHAEKNLVKHAEERTAEQPAHILAGRHAIVEAIKAGRGINRILLRRPRTIWSPSRITYINHFLVGELPHQFTNNSQTAHPRV